MRLLLVFLLLTSPGLAQTVTEIRFETIPQGCTVMLLDSDGAMVTRGEVGSLALTADLLDRAGDPLRFRLLKPGFAPALVEIDKPDLEVPRMRWPRSSLEFLRLRPQLIRAVLRSSPPGAEIWLDKGGREEYLGLTGETLHLNLAELVGDTSETGYFELRLELAGYHSQTVPVPNHALSGTGETSWPPDAPYALRPKVPVLIPLYSLAGQYPVVVAFTVTFALGLWFGWLWPAWQERQLRLKRAERIVSGTASGVQKFHAGLRLGPYRLGATLGAGGMGTVYKALPEDTLDPNRSCAVKVMNLDREETRKFAAEVKILLALEHPGILRLDDWGEQDGLVYLVTELVEGQNLRDWMLDRGPLPQRGAAQVLLELCRAVAFAHRRGVVHGDLKPENILVDPKGRFKIADFGLARATFVEAGHSELHGTPGYIAPELFRTTEITPLSDQYALGVIGYELFRGRRPEPELQPSDDPLEAVLARMLDPDPARRFPSLEDVISSLP